VELKYIFDLWIANHKTGCFVVCVMGKQHVYL